MTSGFLQIPPHDEHPCLRLTLPTAERVVVFHHLVVAHAGRTKMQSEDAGFSASSLSAHERYWVDTPARGCLSPPGIYLPSCGLHISRIANIIKSSVVCPTKSKDLVGARNDLSGNRFAGFPSTTQAPRCGAVSRHFCGNARGSTCICQAHVLTNTYSINQIDLPGACPGKSRRRRVCDPFTINNTTKE